MPPEIGDFPQLQDVNRDGIAVGEYDGPDGRTHGCWADSEGGFGNLQDLFQEAMLDFPGWRFAGARNINAAGKIAGRLSPIAQPSNTPDTLIVVGDLTMDPPTLTLVAQSTDETGAVTQDMNEKGDLLVRVGGSTSYWLYRSPYMDAPERIEFPWETEAQSWRAASVNSRGQVLISANFLKTVRLNRKRTETQTVPYAYLRESESDGTITFTPLGASLAGNVTTPSLAEDGSVYTNQFDSDFSLSYSPTRWSPNQGWEMVSPLSGRVPVTSKADSGSTEVAIRATNGQEHVVYREGWGPYRIEVVQAQQTGGLELWYRTDATPLMGMSRPNSAVDAGFICGWDAFIWYGGSRIEAGFILTPINVSN